jgi:8-amino-3,8-dideoxy-alpha-D-manno-octulosonate transaminase
LSEAQQKALIALQHTDFSKSDAVMSKCISTAISLLWTEEQIHEKGAAFLAVLKKVVA